MLIKSKIKLFETLETPFYYYDLELLDETLGEIREYGISRGYHIHYAVKANFDRKLLSRIREAGLGIDCVSGKEIERAIETGFRPDQIAFAGVGKTDREIRTGLEHDIFSFNCESVQELQVLNELAVATGKTARVAIRLNPNVEAKTHKYITTGLNENKFGIHENQLPELFELLPKLNAVELTGIHFHIGSQIRDLEPFRNLCKRANDFQTVFEENGHSLKHVNLGGGYGINYAEPNHELIPDFESFFKLFEDHLEVRPDQEIHFELGRSIVGQCGSLISRVLYIKEGKSTRFAVLDAGMTELIRPALYQSDHKVEVLTSDLPEKTYDVVGPICESSDTFRRSVTLPELRRGDLVAIRSAGAYGKVMSSGFNLREPAAIYYSDELFSSE